MNTKQIFDLAIKQGIEADLRGKTAVLKMLKHKKEQYDKLSEDKKKEYDTEALTNPYIDSRIHHLADEKKTVKKVLTGIDMEGDELLLAKQLGDIDLVIAHHPRGKALADLADVMHMQAEVYASYGIPINIAEGMQHERISEVARGVSPANHFRVVDMARLLDISLINVHTPTDNLVATFLKKEVEKAKPEYVSDIVTMLKQQPEYQIAIERGAGPVLFAGRMNNRCGTVAVTEITGGTEPSAQIYQHLAAAGVGTVISMHQSEEHKKAAAKHHINVVIAGHISSDSLGMNLFLDKLEEQGIEIVPASGLIRVSRAKKKATSKRRKK